MKRILIFTLILFSGICLKAQKTEIIESKEEVIKLATTELDQAMTPTEGELYKFGQKYKITGEVVSVFISDKKNGNIPSQNILKDKVMDFKFSFKMPKTRTTNSVIHLNSR